MGSATNDPCGQLVPTLRDDRSHKADLPTILPDGRTTPVREDSSPGSVERGETRRGVGGGNKRRQRGIRCVFRGGLTQSRALRTGRQVPSLADGPVLFGRSVEDPSQAGALRGRQPSGAELARSGSGLGHRARPTACDRAPLFLKLVTHGAGPSLTCIRCVLFHGATIPGPQPCRS